MGQWVLNRRRWYHTTTAHPPEETCAVPYSISAAGETAAPFRRPGTGKGGGASCYIAEVRP